MPYYGMPVGTEYEEVGFGFNHGIVTGLLRERLGITGIVCTDWGILNDSIIVGEPHVARAWGVEHLTPAERLLKAVHAGIDQFGGEHCPELAVELVRAGSWTTPASTRRRGCCWPRSSASASSTTAAASTPGTPRPLSAAPTSARRENRPSAAPSPCSRTARSRSPAARTCTWKA
ncbi:hypothetical protein ACFCWG_44625 [Streptomyces sp. NPDC056390]|uniref:hypothetical protein n=1 Tax=Streptomyces sp. NPDC056390 TaxID=3345806 RepID=UPI0035D61D6F